MVHAAVHELRRGQAATSEHGRKMTSKMLAWLVACSTCASTVAFAQEEPPPVVPYRPSVATPADLPAPGWPELEAGWNGAKGGGAARSQSVPLLFKMAWNERWGFLVGTDVYDRQRDPDGTVVSSGGDTTLAVKYRWPVQERVSLGAQLGVALPTARRPFGSGRADWNVTTIASFDVEATHIDINGSATLLGAADDGQGRWKGGWAVAGSHPLQGPFGVTGEVSGVAQRGTSAQTQGLVALTYNASRRLVLDVAVAAGLSRAAPDWQLIAGMTVQLGHWF